MEDLPTAGSADVTVDGGTRVQVEEASSVIMPLINEMVLWVEEAEKEDTAEATWMNSNVVVKIEAEEAQDFVEKEDCGIPTSSGINHFLLDSTADFSISDEELEENDELMEEIDKDVSNGFKEAMITLMLSEKSEEKFEAVRTARKLLSQNDNPPINAAIDVGLVPRVVNFLKTTDNPEWLLEGAWLFTNIATGNEGQVEVLAEKGAVMLLVEMLSSPHSKVAAQAAWALGNIVIDGPLFRDYAIRLGVVPKLVSVALSEDSAEILMKIAFAIYSIFHQQNLEDCPPVSEVADICLPALVKLIDVPDNEIRSFVCCTLCVITNDSTAREKGECRIQADLIQKLVQLLDSNYEKVIHSSLRTLANVTSVSADHSKLLLAAGVIPYFKKLLGSKIENDAIIHLVSFCISNIVADDFDSVKEVVDSGLLSQLIPLLKTGSLSTKKDVLFVITNISCYKDIGQLKLLLYLGVVPALCHVLKTIKNYEVIDIALEGAVNILEASKVIGPVEQERVTSAFQQVIVQTLVNHLQMNTESSMEISKSISTIMEKYLDKDQQSK